MDEPRRVSASEGPPWLLVLDDVTDAMRSLASVLDTEPDERVLLEQVCDHVVRVVPGVESATITLVHEDSPRTAATTDELCAKLDLEQYRTGAGPCLEAAATGTLVRVAVGDALQRWPSFAQAARDAGMASFLSAPLVLDHAFAGAINCYSTRTDGFADLDARLLELYVSAVEAALRGAYRYQQARLLVGQLREALSTRAVIDQAKGILMAVRGLSAEEAFAALVDQASNNNIKLRELAQRFVDEVYRHGEKS